MNDNSARTDDVLFTYIQPVPAITAGAYYYDGQVAAVSRGADDQLERLFVYGGTFLRNQATGKDLVSNLDRNEPFEATYADHAVAAYGNITTEVTLYAPHAEHVTLNGVSWPFARSGDYITFAKPNQ
jgi:hypothetical protein